MRGPESSSMSLTILILLIASGLFFCCISAIAETNTLNQSETLNFTQQLVSHNKKFTLGFVKPFVDRNNNNTYLAIWNSEYESSLVWIANRETPITYGSSATLFIHHTGKFVINRTHGGPIQLCPGEETNNYNNNVNYNTKAVLLDNGNLVLTEVNSNGSVGRTLWQSFDCPIDALLPGMKLGINHRTGKNWSLTSWLALDDPSPGAFTLEWNPNDQELVVRRRGTIIWTSGMLKNVSDHYNNVEGGRMRFGDSGWLESIADFQYYRLMSNKSLDEEVFSYSLKHADPMDSYRLESIKLWIDYNGMLSPSAVGVAIPLGESCYGYRTEDNGCARWSQPQCRSEEDTTFELMSGYFMNKDNNPTDFDDYKGEIGPADCRVNCWNDCDCQAYLRSETVGCSVMSQDKLFRPDPSGSSRQYYVIQRPQNGKCAK